MEVENEIDLPLVSVCVISYCSANTIIGTLESIKNQDYKKIELIISDDCSTDNTVEIAEKWLSENATSFISTQFIRSEKNTGVTKNTNRAVKIANGIFIKDIAADDKLEPTYCSKCINYFQKHPEVEILFTKVRYIDENGEEQFRNSNYDFFNLSAKEQFDIIISKGVPFIPTPSSVYRKSTLEKVNYFDERIPMWEDGPMYYTLTKNGIKLHLLNEELVIYSVLKNSLSNSVPYSHRKSIALFYFYDIIQHENKFSFTTIKHCIKFSLFYLSKFYFFNWILNLILKNRKHND